MPHRERMSPVDTAWLRMDSPGNLMLIVGVDIYDGPCDLPRLRKVIEEHLLTHFPFRARAVQDATGAWWEEDEDFDLDRHLVRIGLPGRGGTRELQKLVAQLTGQGLDPQRPLWQFHLVENYDGGHALIVRIHHCVGDGMGLVGLLMGMTSSTPGRDADSPARPHRGARHGAGLVEEWLQPFAGAAMRALGAGGDLARRALAVSGNVLDDPRVATELMNEIARTAAQVARDAAAIALMEDDTKTSLKGKPGGTKVVAWNEPLPLEDVKAIGHALGCSVNDVLLACAAGAIRAYLERRGEPVQGTRLRAMVPVNLRPPGRAESLGNKFGLVPLLLPIDIDNPLERVFEVHRRMNELKDGYTAIIALGILGATGLAPRLVQKQVLDMLASKATAVITNVPGPPQARYLAGSRLRQILGWVPQTGDIGLGIAILSYDGGVQFGLVADKKLCARPQEIIDRIVPEFETLLYAVLLAPWDEGIEPQVAERALAATESLAKAATRHPGGGDGRADARATAAAAGG